MIAYDTRALRPFKGQLNTLDQYVREQVQLNSDAVEDLGYAIALTEYTDSDIPKLFLPYQSKDLTIIDKRPFLSKKGEINKRPEWDRMRFYARLENTWFNNPEAYLSMAPQLANVFGTWISQMLSARFSTSIEDTEKMRVLAGCYYYFLIYKNVEGINSLPSDELNALSLKFAVQKMRMSPRQAEAIFTSDEMKESYCNLHGLVKSIVDVTDSPAVRFDEATLLSLASIGSWFGNDADIISQVALEHPPVLSNMIMAALDFSIYRKTRIGQAVNVNKRHAALDDLTKWFKRTSF